MPSYPISNKILDDELFLLSKDEVEITVEGDTMNPNVKRGSVIVIDVNQPVIKGEIYAISINECAFLGKIKYIDREKTIITCSNKSYPDITITKDSDIKILGLFVKVLRSVK